MAKVTGAWCGFTFPILVALGKMCAIRGFAYAIAKHLRLVAQSCLTLCHLMDCSLPGSSVHGDSPGESTGVGCHTILHGFFPTQGLNPGLPHCGQILC